MRWFSKETKIENKEKSEPSFTYHNERTEHLFHYHNRTKHTYSSVYYNTHYLDWDNQPNPFRMYSDVPVILLARKPDYPNIGALEALKQITETPSIQEIRPTLETISQMLYYSMAISAWKQVRDSDFRYSLRVNPSSGNLHPTETHLALTGVEGIEDGLYHYRVPEHALEQRGIGDFVTPLSSMGNQSKIVLVLTSIFWRESWKYRDRAYRYCLHDMGHAALSILTSAKGLGFHAKCIGNFSDQSISRVMGLADSDENPMLLISFNEKANPETFGEVPETHGTPNRLSEDKIQYSLIEDIHEATLLPENVPLIPTPPQNTILSGDLIKLSTPTLLGKELKLVARTRRSALDFKAERQMSMEELSALLFCSTRGFSADFRGNLAEGRGKDFISLYLYIHRVEGIPQGVYQYDPIQHALLLKKEGDQKSWAAGLSLGQAIASNCHIAFSMIADLALAAKTFGNRGYRYVHFEAGAIGQGLYLAAEALGYNATGIGAFFDEDVHRYLDLTPEQGQVIYHFSVGEAVLDDRLIQISDDLI